MLNHSPGRLNSLLIGITSLHVWLHDVYHVSQLKKFIFNLSQTLHYETIQLNSNLTFSLMPSCIVDRTWKKTFINKMISLVIVVWEGMPPEENSWEMESEVMDKYMYLFY